MNKIIPQSLNLAKNQKSLFVNCLSINLVNNSKLAGFNILNTQKKHFSIDYAEMEKKLNAFYEAKEKAKLEYLRSILSEKEKREAEIISEHIDKLDEDEKDYFKVKLESEMRKLFDAEIMKSQYTISNMNLFEQIELDGKKFGFGDNLKKNILPFYGQTGKVVVAAGK